jgi:Fuc2NAc and GlcNAc transferase
MPGSATAATVLLVVFAATLAGTRAFRAFAIKAGIVANPNFRSLHERPKPRAAGIVFASVCLVTFALLWVRGAIDEQTARVLVAGGAVATICGLLDDLVQMRAIFQLLVQAALSAWVVWAAGAFALMDWLATPAWLTMAVVWFGFVWLMNVYNFMDGIDGMAGGGAVFFSGAAIVLMALTGNANPPLIVFGTIAAAVTAYLVFNLPPASLFMGSAGSLFLGFFFCGAIALSVAAGALSLWTWLVLFGYFAGDTTTTTVLRVFLTPRWYGEHRSHAYQNLARVGGSHRRVLYGVTAYHVLWLFPLALWSVRVPAAAPAAAALAFAPVIVWTYRYGPRLSSS